MKKILFWAAVTILAAVSCNKELENRIEDNTQSEFIAYVDGTNLQEASKTVMTDAGVSLWNGKERIWVFNGQGSWKKAYVADVENAERAVFTEENTDASLTGETYMAVYPAAPATDATWSGDDVVNLYLKNEQELVEGSYDPECHIAIASTTKDQMRLEFKNVVALVKFKLTGDVDKVSEVCFYTIGEEKITGNFNLSNDSSNPTVTGVSEDKVEYSYNYVKNAGTFKENTTYYLAVLPGTYGSGFGVEALTSGVKCTKQMSQSYTLNRNEILDLGVLTATAPVVQGSGWFLPGGHNSWNTAGNELFEEGNYYVVKNITPTSEGFKFYGNNTWKGISGTTIALDTWTAVGGSNNIKVSELIAYDIYLTKDALQCYITKTGNPAPTAPESPYKDIYLDVTKNWSDSGAKFDAWIWGSGEQWVDFVQIGTSKLYKVQVPKGTTAMKVMRRGPSQTSHSWDDGQKWNTTGDITLGSNNLITITGWDNSYTLSTYTE